MHFDTTLLIIHFISITKYLCFCQYLDDQSYLSLVEFNRGGSLTSVILSSPHGGFLGADFTSKQVGKTSVNAVSTEPLVRLPMGGCYNSTLDRCIYSLRDCLRSNNNVIDTISFYPDARCMIDQSSTSTMYSLTKAIAESFPTDHRPFTILNKLTRQYVDPAEDLLTGTFLLESSTRVYMDYHRFIAMAKESIRARSRGLYIEFVFHKHSEAVHLGYGFEPGTSSMLSKPSQSTITDLVSRIGSSVIKGNNSLSYYLHRHGFQHVLPLEQHKQIKYRLSTHSTRMHADQRFNAILFSYPIERLRTHTLKLEAIRIAKAIEQFIEKNHIKSCSTPSLFFASYITVSLLFSSQIFFLYAYLSLI